MLIYGFGVIIEDATDDLTDSESKYLSEDTSFPDYIYPSYLQVAILKPEREHRFNALFKICSKENCTKKCKKGDFYLNGLGKGIFAESNNMSQHYLTADKQLFFNNPEDYLAVRDNDKKLDSKEREALAKRRQVAAEKKVNGLYYTAKNWAYTQPNHFKELESIQRRVDYTRSGFLIASWSIVASIFIVLAMSIVYRLPFLPTKDFSVKRLYLRGGYTVLCMIVICSFTKFGFDKSETNFNERAFGYYLSRIQSYGINDKESVLESTLQYQLQTSRKSVNNFPKLFSNLWLQTSGEYKALCLQVFNDAYDYVSEYAKGVDVSNSINKYAVVMDLDETILDNSKYQTYLVSNGLSYEKDSWLRWVKKHAEDVELVPGAKAFIKDIEMLGIIPVYISNRPHECLYSTIKALKHCGINVDNIKERMLLKLGNESDKSARREKIEDKYTVIALLGDNLGDFEQYFNDKGTTLEKRSEMVYNDKKNWSNMWFLFPNPVYGSWTNFINNNDPISNLKKNGQ